MNNRQKLLHNVSNFSKRPLNTDTHSKSKLLISSKAPKSPFNNPISLLNPKIQKKSLSKSKLINSKSKSPSKAKISFPKAKLQNSPPISNDPLYSQIKSLWDLLGVTLSFKNIFDNVSVQLVPLYREEYFKYELCQLMKISSLINRINNDIEQRESMILQLKQYKHISIKEKDINIIKENLNKLRDISVCIVEGYNELRKEISYDVLMNKHDIEKIFNFKKDYLLRMKNDTDFLVTTTLNRYFSFSNESDPFLTSITANNNSNKQFIPISNDKRDIVNRCQYILLQEMIYNECNKYMQIRTDVSLSSNSIKSIKSSHKLNTTMSYDIHTFLNRSYKNELNRGKTKSNDYKRIKPKIPINKQCLFYDSKTPKKNSHVLNEYWEEVKSGTINKFINFNVTKGENGKERNNNNPKKKVEYLNNSDLVKIEEIINRSLQQKNKILNNNSNKYRNIVDLYKRNESNCNFTRELVNHTRNKTEDIKVNNHLQNPLDQLDDTFNIPDERDDHMNLLMPEENKIIIGEISNQKEEEKISNDKNEQNEFSFEVFTGDLSLFVPIYREYYKKIPNEQLIAFHINESIDYYLNGIFPKIFQVKSKGNILIGVITTFYNPQNQTAKILQISSISTSSTDTFSNVLSSFISYCNNNFLFEEIYLEFYFGVKDGQFYMIKELESIIKNEAKFKWVNMENDGIDRKIKYKYKTNSKGDLFLLENKFPNSRELMGYNVIKLKAMTIASFIEREEYDNQSGGNCEMNEVNDFDMICILGEMIGKYHYSLLKEEDDNNNNNNNNSTNDFVDFMSKIEIEKLRKITKEFTLLQFGHPEDIKNYTTEVFNEFASLINNKLNMEVLLGTSMLNVESSFDKVIQTTIGEYQYNIIEHKIEVFELNSKQEHFYLLHSTNENLSLLLYEFKEEGASLSSLLYDNVSDGKINSNATEAFKLIYKKIDQQQKSTIKRIFIPAFSITHNDIYDFPLCYHNMLIASKENCYMVHYVDKVESFEFCVENNNKNSDCNINSNILFTLKEQDEDEVIIKNDFILALVNPDLLCEVQIPSISTFVVRKDNWIKST